MTEAEWNACTDPQPMLELLRGKVSDRKLRLFGVPICRAIGHLLADNRSRKAIEAAERYTDGELSETQFARIRTEALAALFNAKRAEYDEEARANFCVTPKYSVVCVELYASCAVAALVLAKADMRMSELGRSEPPGATEQGTGDTSRSCNEWAALAFVEAERIAHDRSRRNAIPRRWLDDVEPPGVPEQASLLRELIGNPFRPVTVNPAWLTSTVKQLAEAIYQEKAFDRMPILGDALEEAGCTDAEMLNHCRQQAEHVRGCWVVDLLLGKE